MATINNYALVETPFTHSPSASGNHVSTLTYRAGCSHIPTIDLGTGNPSVNALTLTTAKSGLTAANDAKYVTCVWALSGINNFSNNITQIDLSLNKQITSLQCYGNQLAALNVQYNTHLTFLACHTNQITGIDVSANTLLTGLYCFTNQLSALNVAANTALTTLSCYQNQLTALDVSTNTALQMLLCGANQITALNVSANTALTSLDFGTNRLTALDVSANTALTMLSCANNYFNDADIDALVAAMDSVAWAVTARVLNISNMPYASNINTGTTCTSLGNLASEGWVINYEQGTCAV